MPDKGCYKRGVDIRTHCNSKSKEREKDKEKNKDKEREKEKQRRKCEGIIEREEEIVKMNDREIKKKRIRRRRRKNNRNNITNIRNRSYELKLSQESYDKGKESLKKK